MFRPACSRLPSIFAFQGNHLNHLRILNGLITIPPDHLKLTTVATRRHGTRYMQIRCNTCMYIQPDVLSKHSPTMEPCTFRYLLPRTWHLQVVAVEDQSHLITHQVFISPHCTILFPEVSIYSHSIGFLRTWPAPAARYYSTTELALVSEDEDEMKI